MILCLDVRKFIWVNIDGLDKKLFIESSDWLMPISRECYLLKRDRTLLKSNISLQISRTVFQMYILYIVREMWNDLVQKLNVQEIGINNCEDSKANNFHFKLLQLLTTSSTYSINENCSCYTIEYVLVKEAYKQRGKIYNRTRQLINKVPMLVSA